MRFAYLCEGETWGPRVRARAVVSRLGGIALAEGTPRPPLEGLPYESICWTDPHILDGYDLVVGDWSCVAMRPPDVYGVAVTIAGQQHVARYGQGRPPDALWDGETRPLHPWATEPLHSRREARIRLGEWWRVPPVMAVLDQSTTPGVLFNVCQQHAARGWRVVTLNGWGADRLIVGADLLVTTGGWSQVAQAKAARVPYVAVEQQSADQWTRAHCTLAELATVIANIAPAHATLPDDWRPVMFDWLPAFAESCGIPVPNPQPLVDERLPFPLAGHGSLNVLSRSDRF